MSISSSMSSPWRVARPHHIAAGPTPSEKPIERKKPHTAERLNEVENELPSQTLPDKKTIKQAKKVAQAVDDTILSFCDKRPKKFTGYCMMVALKVVKQTIDPRNGKANVIPLFFYTTSRELARFEYNVMEGSRILDHASDGNVNRYKLAISRYVKGKIQEIFIHENTKAKAMELFLMGETVHATIEGKVYPIHAEGNILRIRLNKSEKPLLRAFAERDDFHQDLQQAFMAIYEKCKNMRDSDLGNPHPKKESKTFSKLLLSDKLSIEMIKSS